MSTTTTVFDPGYSKFSVSIPEEIPLYINEIKNLKAMHTKKFEFTKLESYLSTTISQIAGIYLGCILWGGYIHCYFDKDTKIEGNPADKLNEEEKAALNYAQEPEALLKLIAEFDRDCKYFLKKPFRLQKNVVEIIEAYKEFAEKNDSFKSVSVTGQVQLPQWIAHFADLSAEQLEKLHDKIKSIIEGDSIDPILEIGFYKA